MGDFGALVEGGVVGYFLFKHGKIARFWNGTKRVSNFVFWFVIGGFFLVEAAAAVLPLAAVLAQISRGYYFREQF
jgi:hypothetical protein